MGAKARPTSCSSIPRLAEKKFMADGKRSRAQALRQQHYIILGPPPDPAKNQGMKKASRPSRRSPPRGASSRPAATTRDLTRKCEKGHLEAPV